MRAEFLMVASTGHLYSDEVGYFEVVSVLPVVEPTHSVVAPAHSVAVAAHSVVVHFLLSAPASAGEYIVQAHTCYSPLGQTVW